MAKKKTHEQFVQEVFEKVGNEYLVLGIYKNARTGILIKHNKCGHQWKVIPDNFRKGQRCPKCAGKTQNTGIFKERVLKLTNGEYSVLGTYKNAKTKIILKHNKCGHEFSMWPSNFLSGQRCPICSKKIASNKRLFTTQMFKQRVYELTKNEYSVLGEYKKTALKVLMRHNKCGYEWEITPNGFIGGSRCPKCAGNLQKDTSSFKEEIYSLVKDEYTVLSEYKNSKIKVLMRHNICGNIYKVSPEKFTLSGRRCPQCNESHGEQTVTKYLRKNHIKFRRQYKIKKCKNINPLPFDFALFNKDKLITLVEYDGEQHNKVVEHFGGKEGLKKRQKNDNIKTNYCFKNRIPLIRIPYTEKDIETYLDNELSKLNKPIQLALI